MTGNAAPDRFTITAKGPFSLAESAGFAFIDRPAGAREPVMRLGFCRDDTWEPTGVLLTQPGTAVEAQGDPAVRDQVARMLALDVDASSFAAVGQRDPVIGRLQGAAPGLRPPLLHSAYEAAAWCILAARRTAAQARGMRARLAEQAGTVLDVEGEQVICLPPPELLLRAAPVRGLDEVRLDRLHGVARAALDGRLDTSALRALDPDDARDQLEKLAGIGPFSSAIIVVRALGHTDVMAGTLTELLERVGQLYGLGHRASPGELAEIAQVWSPWRTWAQVHIRAVSDRLSADRAATE
jgi:DNA-3-methyladenine glycosylase II